MSLRMSSPSFESPGAKRCAVWLGGFVFLCFIYFLPRWHDWNQDARMDLTMAIVNHGTVSINAYQANTGDEDFFKGNYYSNKAPGQSLAGVPVYLAFKGLLSFSPIRSFANRMETNSAWTLALEDAQCLVYVPGSGNYCRFVMPKLDFALLQYIESITTAAVPATLLVLLLFFFLRLFTSSVTNRLLVAGIVGLGTIVFPYAQNDYSHVPATLFCLAAFAILYTMGRSESPRWLARSPKRGIFLAGFSCGLAAVFEYPALLVLPILALYCLRRFGPRRTLWFVGGAMPALAIDLAYNYAAYQDPFTTGYGCTEVNYSTQECQGIGGFTLPPNGNAVSGLSLDRYRGLIFLSPFLTLAFPGYLLWLAARREEWASVLTTAAIPVTYFLAICCYWGWFGGQVVGPRYIAPVIPFLAIPIVFVIDRVRDTLGRIAIYALAMMSLINVWVETIGGRQFGWTSIYDPLFEYNFPQLLHGQVPLNIGTFLGLTGWRSLLPLALFLAAWSAAVLARLPKPASRSVGQELALSG